MPDLPPLFARLLEIAAAGEGLGLGALLIGAALLGALLALGLRRSAPHAAAFQALAAEALQRNNEGFLALAGERLRALQEGSAQDLAGRQQAIEALVTPLHEAIGRYQQETRALERHRVAEAGALGAQLQSLASQTAELARALRSPHARGRWGELTLRRTVELAGLSEHCDFSEQVTLGAGRGAGRPDLLVRLPSGREIAVDAKAPLDAYLEAASAESEEARGEAYARHGRLVRRHVEALAQRGYPEQLPRSPEFVVLFLPHEGFLAAAIHDDPALVAFALERGVVIATPATLYALLAAVAQGWREQRLADGTRQVLALAREMDERLGIFTEHLGRLGGALGRAVDAFNASVGSLETRVLAQARRLRELGVNGSRSLDAPDPIDTRVRQPTMPEDAGAPCSAMAAAGAAPAVAATE